MNTQTPFEWLFLRAVLRNVSPMVIRVLAVPDYLDLASFDEVFCAILAGMVSATSFAFTDRSSTTFAAEPSPRDCGNFSCDPRKTFSTHAVRSTFGNRSCGFWIRKTERTAIRSRFVWKDAVRLLRSIVAVPLVIDSC